MGVFSFLAHKKVWAFAGGVLAGLVVPKILQSKTARKAAVSTLAKGMELKDDAKAAYESIKEDAQDVYAEAQQQSAEKAQSKANA
ncbi:MAG: DUF6110 family protein [Oscillospiraceae bacterium]